MTRKPFVHIIHGIHVSEGSVSTPATLTPLLESAGYACFEHDYGYASAFTSRWLNPKRAKKFQPLIIKGDIILAHSNGCDIAVKIVELGAKPAGLVLLQPALDHDTIFPRGDYWINVFYNEHDRVTWLSQFLFGHPYGSVVTIGHTRHDERVRNFNTLKLCERGGHSKHIRHNMCVRRAIVHSMDAGD